MYFRIFGVRGLGVSICPSGLGRRHPMGQSSRPRDAGLRTKVGRFAKILNFLNPKPFKKLS